MRAGRTSSRRGRIAWWVAGGATGGVVLVLGVCAALVLSGVLWPNRIFASAFPVRGIDVSTFQGRIDWPELADQDIDFAFIKATEGSSDQDSRFAANWAAARKTRLIVGAYHFLSFDSPGETQAENIIRTVPAEEGTLPVAIDLELYGDYLGNPPSAAHVRGILGPLIAALSAHYGRPPIIYATQDGYDRYLKGAYPDDPVWIRSVALPPQLPDGRAWAFWQYSDRDRLPGYDGEEEYVDVDVFAGSRQQLETLLQHSGQ